MKYLIDQQTQDELASHINESVIRVINRIDNHGNEEGLTSVLGQQLMDHPFKTRDTEVTFFYRQLHKQIEEPPAGADGGFIVLVKTPNGIVEKASLFQAKRLDEYRAVRDLRMDKHDALRLKDQAKKMLQRTKEAVGVFYTRQDIYVVDADYYANSALAEIRNPLSRQHRLISLGTYLGRWMARCTRGDQNDSLLSRIRRLDGFRQNMTMEVLTKLRPIEWHPDRLAERWQNKRR